MVLNEIFWVLIWLNWINIENMSMSKCNSIDVYYNGNLTIVGFSSGFYSPWVISVFQLLCVISSGSRVNKWSLQLNPSVFCLCLCFEFNPSLVTFMRQDCNFPQVLSMLTEHLKPHKRCSISVLPQTWWSLICSTMQMCHWIFLWLTWKFRLKI